MLGPIEAVDYLRERTQARLARALAQACGIKFMHVGAAQWQSAGGLDLHLRAIRTTFSEARRYAPVILFIDEIDSLGNREQLSG